MKHPRKVAFDMSSFLWRGLKAGIDHEHGQKVQFDGKDVVVNSAVYGYENVINLMTGTMRDLRVNPIDCILVFEGKNSKGKRLLLDNTYKGGGEASHPPEAYIEFQNLRERMQQVWRDLGATIMTQDFAEGDDTLAYLAQEYEGELIVATFDGDLTVLNTEDGETNEYGGVCKVWIDGKVGLNKYGTFPYKYTTIYKAMVGDTSDKVKGVVDFGSTKFFELWALIGQDGIDELIGLLETNQLDEIAPLLEETERSGKTEKSKLVPTKLAKLMKLVWDSRDSFQKAWRVVKVRPEWVNTTQAPLQIIFGKVSEAPVPCDERLEQWYASNYLIDANNYSDAMDTLLELGPQSPFIGFDIETSTPEASDEWLAAQGDPDGVDQLGSVLTGFSLTFGPNMQHTVYVCVDHAETENITMVQARKMLELVWRLKKKNVIQNTAFELTVLYQAEDEDGTLWRDHWKDNGYHGFVPDALDTQLEGSYVNENIKLGLKLRSKHHLNYEQQTFQQTTRLQGRKGRMQPGGRLIREWLDPVGIPAEGEEQRYVEMQERQYKMNELTGEQVFGYGADDTICTAALHVGYHLIMCLEHTWDVYLRVEIDAAYQHAKNFIDGINVSIEKSRELEKHDDATYEKAWGTMRNYLIANGWDGTVPPTFTQELTAKDIKWAYAIYTGQEAGAAEDEPEEAVEGEEGDEPNAGYHEPPEPVEEVKVDEILKTKVRTPKKIIAMIRDAGHEILAQQLEACMAGADEGFTNWIRTFFKGEPVFKNGNRQIAKLIYDVMELPVRVRGKPTKKMLEAGIREGNRKGDALALEYALRDAGKKGDEKFDVISALKLMTMVKTRRSLYYSKYPNFVHWKTGKIHPSHNQSATNTRRASESKPNKQQLPKHAKIKGEPARYREVIVPHKPGAVVVSLDFDSQELRVIADYSNDPNMVACYVGDNKKDMHSMTGVGILNARGGVDGVQWSYETFKATLDNEDHPSYGMVKEMRALGKKTNFTTEYGAMAPKLAATLMCSEDEAQSAIDAKEAAFPIVGQWKKGVIAEAREKGFVLSREGARRHLWWSLFQGDRWEQSKAERQAVNYEVQGSCAEMTKKAEGRMWADNLFFDFDAVCYGPVHDEVVASVMIEDLAEFLPRMHKCMVAPYGGMFVPIESSISFGPSFGEQHEIGLAPTPEAIAEGLAAIAKAAAKAKQKETA